MSRIRERLKLFLISLAVASAGVALAATFNQFSPATGILKGSASTYVTTAASSSDLLTVIGTVPVGNGGTGLASGTSGGIPYYSASNTIASSGALTANRLVLGGGAGVSPTVVGSLGATTTLLHGNAAGAPTFSAVSLTADVSGTLPVANGGTNLTSATDDAAVVGNGTTWQAVAIPNCGSSTQALAYSTSTNSFSCQTVSGSGAALTTGTWTSSLSVGCTVAQNQAWSYSQIGSGTGSIVTITSNSTPACTSNSGSFSTASGSVPSAIRPSRQITFSGLTGTDNGANSPICITLLADGTLSYLRQSTTTGECGATTFTNSGVKAANLGTGTQANVDFTYRIE